jgi:hypothetical protein
MGAPGSLELPSGWGTSGILLGSLQGWLESSALAWPKHSQGWAGGSWEVTRAGKATLQNWPGALNMC